MKILFVNPPVWMYQSVHYRLNRPLGAPMLCSVLRAAGHKADFIDAEALQWHWGNVSAEILSRRPDVVAASPALYHNRRSVQGMAAVVRELEPNVRLIAGGPFATSNPQDVLDYGYDAVCAGEGEGVILDMLGGRNGIYEGSPQNLDALPIPAHHACFPAEKWYVGNEPRFEHPEAVSLWTRGCPFRCSFCSNPVYFGQSPRLMNEERIIEELRLLKRRGIKHVFVYSDELVGCSYSQDVWLQKVCNSIWRLGLTYKTQGRCRQETRMETYESMVAAGFRAVMWGVESFSNKVLASLNKHATFYDNWVTLRRASRAGLKNWVFLMVAGTDETEADFQETVKWTREAKRAGLIHFGQVSIMTAEPGTAIWDLAATNGWFPQTDPTRSHFSGHMNYPWASPAEQERRREILAGVLSDET